jgi:thiamine-phosphate pyrophosphorylase
VTVGGSASALSASTVGLPLASILARRAGGADGPAGPCQTGNVQDPRRALARSRLYLICDAQPDAFLDAALRGGVDIVQLRAKHVGDDEIVAAGRRYAAVCARHGALLIINDRPDLVDATGADGVHVGQDDVAIEQARRDVGPNRIVGLSTHSPAQIDAAGELADVDYIGVGPIHATPTKPGRPAVGLELVRYAAAHAAIPFFAIGGVDSTNAAAVHTAGARRIAVVRALTQAGDPEVAAATLRAAIGAPRARGAGVGAT